MLKLILQQDHTLHGDVINIPEQSKIPLFGYAIQSRVTTEDPQNNFMPDTGKLMVYRSSGGFGVRLDAGNGFQGAVIITTLRFLIS